MGELTYLMQHIRIKQLVINSKSFPISQLNVIKMVFKIQYNTD